MVSRDVNLHSHYKQRLETVGYKNITTTAADKDGLSFLVNDVKPRLVLMDAYFYQCATPYMMSLFLQKFPGLNIAAVSIPSYPADLAMWFIINGVKSYLTFNEGADQFYRGLDCIRDGKKYIACSVQERIEKRREIPMAARKLTQRQIEVVRLLCNGFSVDETADCLHISDRTVDALKREIYMKLNVRKEVELVRVAIFLEIIKVDELVFYGGNYQLKPEPIKQKRIRRVK
jgi:DNA-binding NarL/FixJ family response regulator